MAAIGLTLTACNGHEKKDNDMNTGTADTTAVVAAPAEKPKEENPEHKKEEPKEPQKEHHTTEMPTAKGTPKVDTVLPEKPKDASTMGSIPTKHHVKPGGVH